MTHDIFIGIDGGGTKSKVRVEDADGNLLGEAVSGPANVRLSVKEAWHSIYAALKEALPRELALEDGLYHFHAGLGLAGCEEKEAVRAFLNSSHPFSTLQLNTDAHIACVGAHKGTEGAIVIVGTGVVGYQIQTGKETRVSGWGFPHDDEGGGAWLGLEAARLTFQWLDQRREASPLVEAVFAYFNRNHEQLVAWANRANSSEFARLAPIVIHQGQQNEPMAVELMKKAAQAVDKIDRALKKMRTQARTLPCCLVGGIAPFIEPWLSEELCKAFVVPQGDATMGALFMIRERVRQDRL